MRSRKALAITMVIFAAGCTRMEQYYPAGTKTFVDGEAFIVTERGEGNYLAVPNDPSKYNLFTVDARASLKNIRAIEQVTQCKVARDSVQHRELNTIATVDCTPSIEASAVPSAPPA